jgi:hypothetical protein
MDDGNKPVMTDKSLLRCVESKALVCNWGFVVFNHRRKIMSEDDIWKSNYKSMNYRQLVAALAQRPFGLSREQWRERIAFISQELLLRFSPKDVKS